ncbi:MAG: hypothetical protein N2652_00425 [Kiritimatiellae bacterium]|nr:hypothetical protein [Kiritimatiellia bacterium]
MGIKLEMWLSRVRRWPKPLRLGGGVALLVLGVLGLFLPVLQGLLFLGAGLALLAADVPAVRRWVDRAAQRWSRQHAQAGRGQWIRVEPPRPERSPRS